VNWVYSVTNVYKPQEQRIRSVRADTKVVRLRKVNHIKLKKIQGGLQNRSGETKTIDDVVTLLLGLHGKQLLQERSK